MSIMGTVGIMCTITKHMIDAWQRLLQYFYACFIQWFCEYNVLFAGANRAIHGGIVIVCYRCACYRWRVSRTFYKMVEG